MATWLAACMIETRVRVRLPGSPDQVFPYLADMRNLQHWGEGITASRQINGDVPAENAILRCTLGRALPVIGEMTGDYRITRLEPNTRIVCRFESRWLRFEDTYVLTAEIGDDGAQQTMLAIRDALTPPSLMSLASAFFAPLIRAQMEKDCENLKRELAKQA